MSTPTDITDPPHLWARLLPEGPLYLALSGILTPTELSNKLLKPTLLQLFSSGHVTLAMFDLVAFLSLDADHLKHLRSPLNTLLKSGCKRIAAATAPGKSVPLSRLFSELTVGMTGVQMACFEQQQAASQWLFSSEPAPTSAEQAPTERTSLVATTQPDADALASTFGAPAGPPPPIPAPTPAPAPSLLVSPPVNSSLVPPVLPTTPSAGATKPSVQPLGAGVVRSAPLLPVLLPGGAGTGALYGRPLLPNQSKTLEHLPQVAVVCGAPPMRFALLRDLDSPADNMEELMAEAVVNLERSEIPLEERKMAGQRFVRSLAPLASEGILSPKFLGKIQDILGAKDLAVAIPTRGTLLATQATSENGAMLQGLATMANELFASGAERALTPHLFFVSGGRLMGPLHLEQASPSHPGASVNRASTLRVLSARTVAEAHLYMDLRGAEPGTRGYKMIELEGELVSTYEARCSDEPTLTRFAFRIENVGAPPGVLGGAIASKIIAPDEFMFWADVLSKKCPSTPEGLSAEQRRRCKVMLETAASCLIEATKFIPPGTERVPESFMALRERWEKLQITPGRFDRARLEVVAKTYNNIASRFGP